MPGPFWAIIIDIWPEARVKPSAIMPAEPSCAQSQKVMPAFGKRSEIGMKAEPMMPKACAMPYRCSTLTKASSVVIFMVAPSLFSAAGSGGRLHQMEPGATPLLDHCGRGVAGLAQGTVCVFPLARHFHRGGLSAEKQLELSPALTRTPTRGERIRKRRAYAL